MATADQLYEEAKCFLCYGMTQAQALKLALLRRKALELDPDADVTPETLLLNASCYNCYANGSIYDLLELALLTIIANGGSGSCENLEGAGSPEGSVTPDFVGQIYNQDGGVIFWQATGLTSADWVIVSGANAAQFDNGDQLIFASEAMTSTTLPIWITGVAGVTQVNFPNLVSSTNYIDVDACSDLVSIDLTSLETCGDGSFGIASISNNPNLLAISLPALTLNDGEVIVQANPLMTTFSAPLLVTSNGNFTLDTCDVLDNPDLTSLVTVNGSFGLSNNTGMVTLSADALITVTGNMIASSNPVLENVSLASYLPTNGTIVSFDNCALTEASVDHILARCVANAAYVTGTVELANGTNSTPSAAGLIDVGILTGRGVTVNHN